MAKWKNILIAVLLFLLVPPALLAAYYFLPASEIPKNKKVTKIVVLKSKRKLLVKSGDATIAEYLVSLARNPVGDKKCQGDGKTPEGSYVLDLKNPGSSFHKSYHISYPDAKDRKESAGLGCNPGGNIMIHGLPNGLGLIGKLHRFYDWTDGCIALTDEEMDELWEVVPAGTPIEILP